MSAMVQSEREGESLQSFRWSKSLFKASMENNVSALAQMEKECLCGTSEEKKECICNALERGTAGTERQKGGQLWETEGL